MAKRSSKRAAPKAASPTVENDLRTLRERLGLQPSQAARLMGWTTGHYIRAESGREGKLPVVIETLAAGYMRAQTTRKPPADPEPAA